MAAWLRIVGFVVALALLGCQPAARVPTQPAPAAAEPVAFGAQPSVRALQRVKVAIVSPNETMAIPWIAQDTGIFQRYGFDAEIPMVTCTPRLVQSLIAGDFDYAIPGVTALVRARLQGADPVILAATPNYLLHQIVVQPTAGIHALADLKGKTIGVSQYGSEADTFLRLVLKKADLQPDDANVLQTGGRLRTAAAVASGNVDAGVVAGISVRAAQRSGAVVFTGGRELGILAPNGTLATTRRLIERDRDGVLRFMQAYVEGIHFF